MGFTCLNVKIGWVLKNYILKNGLFSVIEKEHFLCELQSYFFFFRQN